MTITVWRYLYFLASVMVIMNLTVFRKYSIDLRSNTSTQQTSSDDFKTIIDFNAFDYLISKPKCAFYTDVSFDIELPYFIIFVHSPATNFEQRSTIRDTWSDFYTRSKTYFLLGAVNSTQLQAKIEEEDGEFGDIIQGIFLDAPQNDTYKHVMGLKWFTYNCANAKYMVKMEDDVFINIPNVFNFLVNNEASTDFLMGKYSDRRVTNRTGERAVSDENYPLMDFPAFADGFALIYSSDVATRLYQKSGGMECFSQDDAFVTGLLRMQLNVTITDISNYILDETSLMDLKRDAKTLPSPTFMFSSKNITTKDQCLLWGKTEWSRMKLNLESDEIVSADNK